MTRCCVPNCSETATHQFPKDEKLKRKWLKAIRRVNFVPKSGSRLCRKHFKESDYVMISKYTGVEHQHKHLKKSAVPSLFPWNVKPVSKQSEDREERLKVRNCKKSLFQEAASSQNRDIEPFQDVLCSEQDENIGNIGQYVDILTEGSAHQNACNVTDTTKIMKNEATQTSSIMKIFSTDLLVTDNDSVNFYTGLETYQKFSLVLSTLMPMANDIKYRWSRVICLSIEEQFLMLLIKLRRNKPDFELGKMFGVSKTEVSNVIITWINFVNDLWSLINIWPSRELVNFYMPNSFKTNYPSTRIIIDGTEIPIQKPSQPDAQKASFSQYKHKNTLKFLVGSSPGGLFTYCSGAYAGSTSDRQIVERSSLFEKCEPGDSIMADRGFNVQDLFASKGVGINIPTFLKGKSQIPGVLLKQDQKLASQRVHIERLIGLSKTYKILTSELNQYYIPLASKIFFICMMLCNFREGIVNKNIN
ncbi:uncharacterized protein LOC124645958 [Helicoverpa zea]|uniref:uncharacterized protein LOC124645958 n=1 Tax=Helicoverpa zea TaxID=7113 RepID=UPI001F5700FA|nr:uncharacterized protein LOC124645958 [Helicoverpa zea]